MSEITATFDDAVHDSQHCFRLLLKAMSEPGKVVNLDRCQGFGSMMAATTQVLLSLADNATPIWLSDHLQKDAAITANIQFHLGSPIVRQSQQAQFAVFALSDAERFDWQALQGSNADPSLNLGKEDYPDSSATVIIEIADLTQGTELYLSGPGIKEVCSIKVKGLSQALLDYLLHRQQAVRFPLGVDFILVAGQQLVCIPRTTAVSLTHSH